MIWNNIPEQERLILWKNLRKELDELELQEQLQNIAKFFSHVPFGSRTLDYYSPIDWPTPWEILYHGSFCKSSISLLMYYTLLLLNIEEDIELLLIDDKDDLYILPLIDNKYILNYHLNELSTIQSIENEFEIIKRYPKDTKKIT